MTSVMGRQLILRDSSSNETIECSCRLSGSFFAENSDSSALRVVVAMSGGVDSSTAAAILRDMGHDVIGITLDFSHTPATCHLDVRNILDAQQVARQLCIPHYVLECSTIFSEEVVFPFVKSYTIGKTPLPCAVCNKKIKFGLLLDVAIDVLGANKIATGHYARIIAKNGIFELHQGIDDKKDQSYFLFSLTQKQLKHIIFPLGALSKGETRQLAQKYGLCVQNKKGSKDICFLKHSNYRNLIKTLYPNSFVHGDILNSQGEVIGTHHGIENYTIGQRRGITVAHNEPLYVTHIDHLGNTITVGKKEELLCKKFVIEGINWLLVPYHKTHSKTVDMTECQKLPIEIGQNIICQVKLRYVQSSLQATVKVLDHCMAEVTITAEGARDIAVTPGQACVMYQNTRLIGGGWISSTTL